VLWISSLIREERENCCDDIAVGETRNKKEFIHALVSFQEYRQSTPYRLAFAGNKSHLLERVKRIVHNDNKTLNIREKLFLLISVFITAGITMAYVQLSPVPVKPVATQVKAAGAVTSWSTAYEENAVNADTSKPVQSVKPTSPEKADGGVKRDVIVADTAVTPEQRQRAWERALAEQQRKLAEAQARLAEQELELNRQQEKLNDLYAEALARTQDLRDSVHGEKGSRARLHEEQLHLDRVKELRLENQYRLQALQLDRNKRLEKGALLKAENQARLQELALKGSDRQFENAMRMRDDVLLLQDGSGERMNKYVEPVIEMLREKKLITRTDDLSFSLDKNGLTVNGKKQPEEIFQDFKKAFLEDPQDYIHYSKKGDSESTSINKHKD